MAAEQKLSAFSLVSCSESLLGFVEGCGDEGALHGVEFLDIWPELHELVVSRRLCDRSGYDERGSGVIDED